MKKVKSLTDERSVYTWETQKGLEGGTLLILHMDVPLDLNFLGQNFRRDPEWLYGEGIGMSRAPIVMLECALRALRSRRILHKQPLGVLCYMDEGRDTRYSSNIIREAMAKAKRVLVLRPAGVKDEMIIQRRGQRKYNLVAEGLPVRPGKATKQPEVLLWATERLKEISNLSSRKHRLSISTMKLKTEAFPMLVPHRIRASILVSYLESKVANEAEENIRRILAGRKFKLSLEMISDRPPMKQRKINQSLAKSISSVAEEWEIPSPQDSSVWPSVAGLIPGRIPVVCGMGPAARDLHTPQEAVNRTSLIQRTLLLAQFLAKFDTRGTK